jgi:hypothetical protein
LPERNNRGEIITAAPRVLHIFDDSGIFLGEIPYPEGTTKVGGIWDEKVYFISSDRISILVYKIITIDTK